MSDSVSQGILESINKERSSEGPANLAYKFQSMVLYSIELEIALSQEINAAFLESIPHAHKCTILISALDPDRAGGEYTSRFISSILQQKSNYSMWRDFIDSKVSDGRAVISMCP